MGSTQAAITRSPYQQPVWFLFLQSTWRWPGKTPRSMGLGDPRELWNGRGNVWPCSRLQAHCANVFSFLDHGVVPSVSTSDSRVNFNAIYGSQFGSYRLTSSVHPKTKVPCPHSLICQAAASLGYFETLVQNVANVGSYFLNGTLVRTRLHLQRLPRSQLSSWPHTKPALPLRICSTSPGQWWHTRWAQAWHVWRRMRSACSWPPMPRHGQGATTRDFGSLKSKLMAYPKLKKTDPTKSPKRGVYPWVFRGFFPLGGVGFLGPPKWKFSIAGHRKEKDILSGL